MKINFILLAITIVSIAGCNPTSENDIDKICDDKRLHFKVDTSKGSLGNAINETNKYLGLKQLTIPSILFFLGFIKNLQIHLIFLNILITKELNSINFTNSPSS